MDTGESQLIGERFLPQDTCGGGVPPDAGPVVTFESSEEEISSEPEVCVFGCLYTSAWANTGDTDSCCLLLKLML